MKWELRIVLIGEEAVEMSRAPSSGEVEKVWLCSFFKRGRDESKVGMGAKWKGILIASGELDNNVCNDGPFLSGKSFW